MKAVQAVLCSSLPQKPAASDSLSAKFPALKQEIHPRALWGALMGNAQELKRAALNGKKRGNSAEMHLGSEGCCCCLQFLFQAGDAATLQCAFPTPLLGTSILHKHNAI